MASSSRSIRPSPVWSHRRGCAFRVVVPCSPSSTNYPTTSTCFLPTGTASHGSKSSGSPGAAFSTETMFSPSRHNPESGFTIPPGHLLQELPVGHVLNTVNYGNGSFVGVQSRHLSIYASREGGCVLVKTLTRKTKQAGLLKKRVLVPFEQIVDVATTNTDLVILEMTSSAQNAAVSVTDENGFLKTTIDNKTTHGCLLNLFAVVVDSSRNIYVSDRNAGKILKYSSVGLYAGCFATSNLLPSSTTGTRKCFVFGLAIDNLKNQMFAIVRGNGAAEIRVYQLWISETCLCWKWFFTFNKLFNNSLKLCFNYFVVFCSFQIEHQEILPEINWNSSQVW